MEPRLPGRFMGVTTEAGDRGIDFDCGAGDTRSPMFISAFGVILVRLPLAYIFGIRMHGGLIGAWIGMCADMTVRALLSSFRYTGGKWLGTRV